MADDHNNSSDANANKLPQHRFLKTKFTKSVMCKVCAKPIRGISTSSGFICSVCSMPIHKACMTKAKKETCKDAIMAKNFEPFVPVVRENCLQNFQRLLYQAQESSIEIPKKVKPLVADVMKATMVDFNAELANKISQIWAQKLVHQVYQDYWQKWQITENADYFFDHVNRIADEGYLPNSQDVLRSKPSSPEKQKSYKDKVLKVWLPKGAKAEITWDPEMLLGEALKKVREQKDIPDTGYVAWDAQGFLLDGQENIPLEQIKSLEIYYFPEGTNPVHAGSDRRALLSSVRKERLSRSWSLMKAGRPSSQKSVELNELEKRNGTISLTIHEAANLGTHQNFEFVHVIISDTSDKRYRTIPIRISSAKLSWDQTFKFNISTSYMEFMIKIWTTSSIKNVPDTMLGQCSVHVENFNDGDSKEDNLKLKKEPKKYKANRRQPGHLRISWMYNDKKLKAVEVPKEGEQQENKKKEEEKKVLEDVYEIGDKLGEGAFSVVKAGVHKENGTKVAIKILDNYSNIENAEEDVVRFQQETSIIKSLDHKHIVKMHDIFEDHEHYYVVMELVSGGELFDQIVEKGAYPEDEAAVLILQVLSALVYLEERQICHRDLKPENLIFTDDTHKTLKLIDFGEAKSCADGPIREYVGTTDYMAPEIIKGGEYDMRVDMWSLGVITYVMLCGFPPWEGENESDVFVNIMTLQYDFPSPEWDEISDGAKEFIRALLSEHAERLTAKVAKNHPWLKEHTHPLVQFSLSLPADMYSEGLLERLKQHIVDSLKLGSAEVDVEKDKDTTTAVVTFNG